MRIKMIFVVSLFLFISGEVFSQQHGIEYLGESQDKIIAVFGKPSKISKFGGTTQLQYSANQNFDTDKTTLNSYGIEFKRCTSVVSFWNYSQKKKARDTFNFFCNKFDKEMSRVKDDYSEKMYTDGELVITVTYAPRNTFMVVIKSVERK